MTENPSHIYFASSGMRTSQSERDSAALAYQELIAACAATGDRYGGLAVIDALISIWVNMTLTCFGAETVDNLLRELQHDLPKIATTIRGMQAKPGEKLDG